MVSQKKKETFDELPPSEKSVAEQLAEVEKQRKELREQIKKEKAEAVQARKHAKLLRNDILAKEQETVDKIQEMIYDYNSLGKKAKSEYKILARIADWIAGDAELRDA